MQKNLGQGIVGGVLMDRHTAFHFLDKSGLKRNRQIRLIRNIEYPLEYYLAYVYNNGVPPTQLISPNDKKLMERKTELAECGPMLKELSVDLVSFAKTTAEEKLIPAELQVNLFVGFSSPKNKSEPVRIKPAKFSKPQPVWKGYQMFTLFCDEDLER